MIHSRAGSCQYRAMPHQIVEWRSTIVSPNNIFLGRFARRDVRRWQDRSDRDVFRKGNSLHWRGMRESWNPVRGGRWGMDRHYWMAAAVGVAALLTWGCAEDPQGKTYLIRHAGVSLSQASEIAEKNTPGRAVKAELQHAGNVVIYEVEIIDIVNQTRKVSVDAETGRVIK
jgi:hypothetical protein